MAETVQVGDTADLICNLKSAVAALECQYKMNVLEEKTHRKEKKPGQPPMFIMIPLEQKKNGDDSTVHDGKSRLKNYRHDRASNDSDSITSLDCRKKGVHRRDRGAENTGPRLRGGVLNDRCSCLHRDGLQDSCPLTECQGQPACLTKPWATCPPAKYYRSLFPEIWP